MLIAEIIGASGAGKSTLSDLLNKKSPQIKAGITVWGLPRTLLMQIAISSFPTVARMVLEERNFNITNSKQIVRLRAFYRHLIHRKNYLERAKNIEAMLLDEGVVFSLSKLRADRLDYRGFMQNWEEETLNHWSEDLDIIFWLDAPDEVLIERVRTREKDHRMKFKSDEEITDFLARYREAYSNIVKRLQSKGGLKVIKFDTEKQTLEEIATEIDEFIKTRDVETESQNSAQNRRCLQPKFN